MIYVLCALCVIALTVVSVKQYCLKKSLREIQEGMEEILSQDTNRLLTISSGDKSARNLAEGLNEALGQLRRERLKYENGDRELKEAVANISHDLRTPLTAVKGYLELLEREEHSPATVRYLSIVRNRIFYMSRLTEELLRYSIARGQKEEKPVSLSLGTMVEENLIAFYGAFEAKGIRPVVQTCDTPVMRVLDPSSVNRVLQNIIANALKYSTGDVTVTVSEDGRITFSNPAPNLTPVSVAKLFDRYYTVETVEKPDTGTIAPGQELSAGLGLSIARLLVERMGGSIDADYQKGELRIMVQFP